jgi:hypothetical protein
MRIQDGSFLPLLDVEILIQTASDEFEDAATGTANSPVPSLTV